MITFRQDYCLIIAEIGINHNGSLELAYDMIDAAAEAGVDVVKFQNISEETGYNFAVKDDAVYDAIKKYSLPDDAYPLLKQRCIEKGVLFMSSGADVPAVRFLVNLGVPGMKVSSGNFTNFQVINEISKAKGLPAIFSTGMSNPEEMDQVVAYIRKCGIENFALTYCVSEYPAKLENINLGIMKEMSQKYNVPIGFSDHTEGIVTSLLARAQGACIVEKHFTLDKTMDGPDHHFSLGPQELKDLVDGIRDIEKVLFTDKIENAGEEKFKGKLKRVMYFNRDMKAGEVITFDDIAAKRPFNAAGISPMQFETILGKQLAKDATKDLLITNDLFA